LFKGVTAMAYVREKEQERAEIDPERERTIEGGN